MAVWQIEEAESRFSELVEETQGNGPQMITRHGVELAVLLSMDEYRALTHKAVRKLSFTEYLLAGPKFDDLDLYLERSKDVGRGLTDILYQLDC